MALSPSSLQSLLCPVSSEFDGRDFTPLKSSSNFQFKKGLSLEGKRLHLYKKLTPNCSKDGEMDVSTSALVTDGAAECVNDTKLREPGISTLLIHFENKFDPYGATSTPIYQTATFKQTTATKYDRYDYTRSGNPTRDALESLLAKLDKANRAFCFTSGMAALAAVTHLLNAGDEIVAGEDTYGGSGRLLSHVTPKAGIAVKRVNTSDPDEVASVVGPKTKLVWIESPTNPRIQISDIHKIAEIAHAQGALLLVDNSLMSPVLSQPLELGADIAMHSATKFVSGHSDVMAGVIAVRDERKSLVLQKIFNLLNLTAEYLYIVMIALLSK